MGYSNGEPCVSLAADLIRQFEGCRLAPYQDAVGYWTAGWGCRWLSDGCPVTAYTPELTQSEADGLLDIQIAKLAAGVNAILPVSATIGQRAALISFAWNEGLAALKRSTLLQLLNKGDVAGAADQFAAWVYAGGQRLPGLVKRRAAEKAVFLSQ